MPKVAEFFADLLVNPNNSQATVEGLTSAFASLDLGTVAEIGSLATLGLQLAKIADEALQTAASFQMFETQTGISAVSLQKWQTIAAQVNVSAEAVAGSIAGLSRSLGAIRMGKGNIAPFAMLGIGANQDPIQVLDQLRDRLRGVNAAVATNIIGEMGLDPAMLQVLRLSNVEFAKFAATAKGMTQAQEQTFLNLKLQLSQTGLAIRDAGYAMAEFLGPAIQQGLMDFDTLITGPKGLLAALKEFPTVAKAIGVILGGIVAWISPLTLGLSLLLAVLDDLAAYRRGGDSVLGKAIEAAPGISFSGIQDLINSIRPDSQINKEWLATHGAPVAAAAGEKKVDVTNNFQITSTATARDLVEEMALRMKEETDRASLMLDNGERNPTP